METTWIFDRTTHTGLLELVDRDRLDLVHRMSTNDLNRLKPGEGASTVLTTALARIIDRVSVYNRGETALMLANYPATVRPWLQKHIFFQDRVKIRDLSSGWRRYELHGPNASEIAEQIAPGASSLALHGIQGGDSLLVARTFALSAGNGFHIFSRSPLDLDVQHGDDATYERLRIVAGLPGAEHELTEAYIPLEAGLWDSVSFSKGCYIGQEIIARMESRNRLAKTLVGLRASSPLALGAAIKHDDNSIGTITSATALDDGSYAALGFVKPDFAEPGTSLTVEGQPVEISAAPLIQARV